jgi:nicotinate phosphoribosyltransferase
VGVRLDSGDLAYLAVQAARMLDQAGFPDTVIVLSNQLDELSILQILAQIQEESARYGLIADEIINRLVYGVGTNLIISAGDSALGGVYKLVAIQDKGAWQPAIKISESLAKTPNPGDKRVWRVYDERGLATADLLSLSDEDPRQLDPLLLHHPLEHGVYRRLRQEQISEIEPLHVDVWREGQRTQPKQSIEELRAVCRADLERLDIGVRRLLNPHIYHVSLTEKLWQMKQDLIDSIKNG